MNSVLGRTTATRAWSPAPTAPRSSRRRAERHGSIKTWTTRCATQRGRPRLLDLAEALERPDMLLKGARQEEIGK